VAFMTIVAVAPLLNTNAQSSKTTSRKARMAVTSPSSRRDLGASCADPLGLKSGKQAFKAMEAVIDSRRPVKAG
jgi:hypothetical protein